MRIANCFNCKRTLSSNRNNKCISCNWMKCLCGACGCNYKSNIPTNTGDLGAGVKAIVDEVISTEARTDEARTDEARAAWVKKTQTPEATRESANTLSNNESQAAGTPASKLSANTLSNIETQAAQAAHARDQARDQAWRSANETNCIKAAGDRAKSKAIAVKAEAEAMAEAEAEAMAEANRIKAESEAWAKASWFTKLWMWLDKNG
jgi:hypothetical protein